MQDVIAREHTPPSADNLELTATEAIPRRVRGYDEDHSVIKGIATPQARKQCACRLAMTILKETATFFKKVAV